MREQSTAHVHRAGAASRRSSDWLAVVAAHAPVGFDDTRDGVCIHRGGTVLYVGETLPRLLGVEMGDAVGAPLLELFTPGDRAPVAAVTGLASAGIPGAASHATLLAGPAHAFPLELTALHAEEASPPVDVLYVCAPSGSRAAAGDSEDGKDGADRKPTSNRATVLICDDEARLGALTAGLLADFGFASVTVASGEAALDALEKAEPSVDVVLLDVNLSEGTSALDVLAAMKTRHCSARVILTSGLAEEDVDTELLSHPCVVGYVAKPYGVDQLVQSVRTAASRARS
ncbi:MAG TPA: response regulator [Polyangiaceae bacterium]|nr:response regulator [Polyangiaceae bacterium]